MGYYMNYKTRQSEKRIDTPSMTSIPKYVECLHGIGIGEVVIENNGMGDDLFSAFINELRIHLCKNSRYTYISTTKDGERTNPYYLHLTERPNETIACYEERDRLVIKSVNIDEAINNMSTDDIILNEFSGDAFLLRGIDAYNRQILPVT